MRKAQRVIATTLPSPDDLVPPVSTHAWAAEVSFQKSNTKRLSMKMKTLRARETLLSFGIIFHALKLTRKSTHPTLNGDGDGRGGDHQVAQR